MKKTMMQLMGFVIIAVAFTACKKDSDPIIVIPPSDGSFIELNGIAGSESGASALNSVFVDLSADKQTAVKRDSWDLGFYNGSDFRVIINNTTFAFAKVTAKTDLSTVNTTDTAGVLLSFIQLSPPATTSGVADDISGDLTKTAIPAISATAADNKVVIINRGTNGVTRPANFDYIKVKITRNGSGYTLQYAPLNATTFSTVQLTKNDSNDFTYINLTDGATVSGFPAKGAWDFQWTYGVSTTPFMGIASFYGFSDLILLNSRNGVQAKEMIYAKTATQDSVAVAAAAYAAFSRDSVSKYTLSSDKWTIGSNWRSTSPATGSRKDRFYVIKDAAGNYYKLRSLSMGAGTPSADGGTRGKPKFEYALIK